MTEVSETSYTKPYAFKTTDRCGVKTVVWDVMQNRKQRSVPPVAHRARPEDLIWFPTPLGEYKTEVFHPGLYKVGPNVIGYMPCPDGVWTYITATYLFELGIAPLPRIVFNSTEWNNRYLDEIRDLAADLSGTLAEIDETARLVVDFLSIANEVSRCITRPLGRRCSRALRKLKPKSWTDVPSAILLHNFAINPLVRSLHDGYEKFLDPRFSLYKRVKFRHVQVEPYDNGFVSGTRKLVVKTSAVLEMEDNGLLSAAYNFGNPAEWIWERIPFSFVIDWVIPVGSFIGALGTLSRVKRGVASRTFKERANGTTYVPPYGELASRNMFTGRYYRRDVVGLPSLPTLFQHSAPASYTTLSSALSLLAVVRNRRFPT